MTAVILLGTAATCSFCGIPLSIEKETAVSENYDQPDAEEDNSSENSISAEDHDNAGSDAGEEEPMAPEISIFIQEGPLYSAEDDVCYYRIGSEVYGNPFPRVTWSKDDSDNAFGDYVAQVNLRRGETYKLVATAANSEGTASSSLELRWGCDGEDDSQAAGEEDQDNGDEPGNQDPEDQEDSGQEEEDQQVVSWTMAYNNESGSVSQDRADIRRGELMVGISESGMEYRGYLSFNILGYDSAFRWAKIHIDPPQIEGSLAPLGDLRIGVLDYGSSSPLDSRVVGLSSTRIASFPGYSGGPIVIENEKLLEQLNICRNAGKSRLQLTIYWSKTITGDGQDHFIIKPATNAKLYYLYQ